MLRIKHLGFNAIKESFDRLHTAVCFFDCSIICILIYTEDLVIVSLLLCHFCTSVI